MSSTLESAGLGEWIKQKRLERKLSLRDLADLAGIAHSSLDKAERGGGVRDSTLELLVGALAGPDAPTHEVMELLLEARRVRAGIPEIERTPDPDREMWVGAYDGLTEPRRKILLELAAQLRQDEKETTIG
jgi:transcriptional regulator with XRE-family HTH domain